MPAAVQIFRPYKVVVRVPCAPAEAARVIAHLAEGGLANVEKATAEPEALELTLLLEEDRWIEDQLTDLSVKLGSLGLRELQDWVL